MNITKGYFGICYNVDNEAMQGLPTLKLCSFNMGDCVGL